VSEIVVFCGDQVNGAQSNGCGARVEREVVRGYGQQFGVRGVTHIGRLIPSAVTFIGHALTIAWLLGAPWAVGLCGLLCDAADGFLARRLGAETRFGSDYDWAIDVSTAVLLCARLHVLWVALAVVPIAVVLHQKRVHVSGRAALTVVALS
jgi:phosphatidylglycerophosphate synthase